MNRDETKHFPCGQDRIVIRQFNSIRLLQLSFLRMINLNELQFWQRQPPLFNYPIRQWKPVNATSPLFQNHHSSLFLYMRIQLKSNKLFVTVRIAAQVVKVSKHPSIRVAHQELNKIIAIYLFKRSYSSLNLFRSMVG